MKKDYNHIIQKYIFELDVSASVSKLDWEVKAHQYTQEIIIPGLEKSFLKVEKEDRHFVIDKLTLDLGSFRPDEFENDAVNRLEPLVLDYLKKLKRNYSEENNNIQSISPDETLAPGNGENVHQKNIQDVSTENAGYLALVYYLNRGRFPWWYDDSLKHLKMEDQFTVNWVNGLGKSEKKSLKGFLQSALKARIRLTDNFGTSWIGEFIDSIGMEGKSAEKQRQMLFPLLKSYFDTEKIFQQQFWNSWIELYDQKLSYLGNLLKSISNDENKTPEKLKKELIQLCTNNLKKKTFPKQSQFLLNRLMEKKLLSADTESNIKKSNLKENTNIKSGNTADKNIIQDPSEDKIWRKLSSRETKNERFNDPDEIVKPMTDKLFLNDEDVMYIEGVGLVLLHPFLQELFRDRNLWEERQWRSEKSIQYALHILAYLVYGEESVKEHQLLMQKILVGMEPDTLLHFNISLQEQDKQACIELLEAVIGHWKALRNTSPQGLRSNFLQRNGKVEIRDNEYMLYIENKAEDILLSHLPWGYGIIKLPWMRQILKVNWI